MKAIISIWFSFSFHLALLCILLGCNPDLPENEKKKENSGTHQTEFITLSDKADIQEINDYASSQWIQGNYQEALSYFSLAYKRAQKENNEIQLANILNNLGLVHWRLEDNESAMECYIESAELAAKLNQKRLLGLTHTNRSLILKEQRQYENAIFHNQQAIDIFLEIRSPRDLAIAYNNQGQIFKNQSNLDSAQSNYLKAIRIYDTIDYKDGMAAAFYNLSEIHTRRNQKDKAVLAAQRSLTLGYESQSKVRISEGYRKLAETYEYFSDSDSALKYHKKYFDSEKDILTANQSDKLIRQQAILGNEVKNLRIQNLEKEKIIANNRFWLISGSVLIILLCVSFLVYRRVSKIRINKKKIELQLANSQNILQIKQKELKSYIIDLSKKNNLINDLQYKLNEKADTQESQVAQLLNQKILTDEDWEVFKNKFNAIYPNFFSRIKKINTPITEAEMRFLVLSRLKLSGKDMANTLGISPQSVRVCKMRLKKKLQEENYASVEEFLLEL